MMEIKFIGAPGTGKGHLMERIREILKEEGVNVVVGSFNDLDQVHTIIIKGHAKYRMQLKDTISRKVTLIDDPGVGGNLVIDAKNNAYIIGISKEVAENLKLFNGANIEITIKNLDYASVEHLEEHIPKGAESGKQLRKTISNLDHEQAQELGLINNDSGMSQGFDFVKDQTKDLTIGHFCNTCGGQGGFSEYDNEGNLIGGQSCDECASKETEPTSDNPPVCDDQ